MSVLKPFVPTYTSWDSLDGIFEQIDPYSLDISDEVLWPVQSTYVEIEDVLVSVAEFVEESLYIIVWEFPTSCWEVRDDFWELVDLSVGFPQPVGGRDVVY